MDENQQKVLASLTDTLALGMDELFRLAYARYSPLLENPDDAYGVFVACLAQTLGRHIAAYPEEEQQQILSKNRSANKQEKDSENIVVIESVLRKTF